MKQDDLSLFKSEKVDLEDSSAGKLDQYIARVAFEAAVDKEFDYVVPDKLWPIQPGQRVEAPFGKGNKRQVGFCVTFGPQVYPGGSGRLTAGSKPRFALKSIVRVVDSHPLIDSQLLELARWISDYYVCPLGQVLAAMVPAAVKKGAGTKTERYVYLPEKPEEIENSGFRIKNLKGKKQKRIVAILAGRLAMGSESAVRLKDLLAEADCTEAVLRKLILSQILKVAARTSLKALPAVPAEMILRPESVCLNADQQKALEQINRRTDSGRFAVTVLHGVTDSGKTELYIRAIEQTLRQGRKAIMLLPEIALTAQTVQRFAARFNKIAVMHSALTGPQRNAQWQTIKNCLADVVIGARSAVFAPLANLGLVVVDEEHEPSYKQDTAPRYNGRDVAIKRAQLAGAHCILGSATPSLETLLNCQTKKHFHLVRLPKRVMDLPMPEMRLIDLTRQSFGQKGIDLISDQLGEHLRQILARREQAILLLNRRGYSNFICCSGCKHTLQCRNCDVTLTFHRAKSRSTEQMPTVFGKYVNSGFALCHYCLAQTLVPANCPLCGQRMIMIGFGSQKLEEELAAKFPQARVARVDSDSMAGADYYKVLRDFAEGRIDILAGTQMLAKGLHFPNVTLVGVINADTSLYVPDFRAAERTFQLISQVAGRAGRSAKKGVVFVQTFLPDQPAIRFALAGDFQAFVAEELKHRQTCNLPPFWRLALITLEDRDFDRLTAASRRLRETIDRIVAENHLSALVKGPMEALIGRIERFHRMQIIVQTAQAETMQTIFAHLRTCRPDWAGTRIAFDIDPVRLL